VQAQCPQCSAKIQIDDAKVPDRPFKVRCPKCQSVIGLPGRGQPEAPEAAAAPPAPPPPAPPAPTPPPAPPVPTPYVPSAATLARRDRAAQSDNDALVALSGSSAEALQQALAGLGFNVDVVEDVEEGTHLLEQGVYEVAVTTRGSAGPGGPETLAQRIMRMPSDARRRVFVVFVGDDFRSGDGTQAWAAQADLVVNPADLGRCEQLIRATMSERRRLYQAFNDARRKIETD
jgi:predicted Zn finger-like uncharacterized protein